MLSATATEGLIIMVNYTTVVSVDLWLLPIDVCAFVSLGWHICIYSGPLHSGHLGTRRDCHEGVLISGVEDKVWQIRTYVAILERCLHLRGLE